MGSTRINAFFLPTALHELSLINTNFSLIFLWELVNEQLASLRKIRE